MAVRITISNRRPSRRASKQVSEKNQPWDSKRETRLCRRGAINGATMGRGTRARGTETESSFEFYCPGVPDSARFQSPLKNPTWLNFWSNYFELNKHPAVRRGLALVSPYETEKGRMANPLAREFHAFVRLFVRSGQCGTSDKSLLWDRAVVRSWLIYMASNDHLLRR